MLECDEWTQEEFLLYSKQLKKQGINTYLVDTTLKPLKGIQTIRYNPFELNLLPAGSVFVFYCDSGKETKERIEFYRSKLPKHHCVSLRGGRGYWRPNFRINDDL
ncbi:MAG: hypothetical protein U9N30_08990 [Campylobacterota bacterium]|nr:hypothetical protein [Campylobacterota bacterium]